LGDVGQGERVTLSLTVDKSLFDALPFNPNDDQLIATAEAQAVSLQQLGLELRSEVADILGISVSRVHVSRIQVDVTEKAANPDADTIHKIALDLLPGAAFNTLEAGDEALAAKLQAKLTQPESLFHGTVTKQFVKSVLVDHTQSITLQSCPSGELWAVDDTMDLSMLGCRSSLRWISQSFPVWFMIVLSISGLCLSLHYMPFIFGRVEKTIDTEPKLGDPLGNLSSNSSDNSSGSFVTLPSLLERDEGLRYITPDEDEHEDEYENKADAAAVQVSVSEEGFTGSESTAAIPASTPVEDIASVDKADSA